MSEYEPGSGFEFGTRSGFGPGSVFEFEPGSGFGSVYGSGYRYGFG